MKITYLEGKLKKLLDKRDLMNIKNMDSYRNGTATRARTTTYNRNVSMLNEEIDEIREFLKGGEK